MLAFILIPLFLVTGLVTPPVPTTDLEQPTEIEVIGDEPITHPSAPRDF